MRLLAQLGVEGMIFTCAAGGLDPEMVAGRMMLIRGHINLTGVNPLTGVNVDQWGERFPDINQPHDPGQQGCRPPGPQGARGRVREPTGAVHGDSGGDPHAGASWGPTPQACPRCLR
ncbi:Inosine-guanosine phosphorylase (modular protein) [Desulfarculales bacterium]